MKANDIYQLKANLDARLKTLRNELNIDTENLKPALAELSAFRSKSGFPQLFYYLFHYSRIRASAEYEALLKLSDRSLTVSPEETDLLELFGDETPDSPFQISAELSPTIEDLKQALHKKLTETPLADYQRAQVIHAFWLSVTKALGKSAHRSDRALNHYLLNKPGLGLKAPRQAIILDQAIENAHDPDFLLHLNSSGKSHDIEEAAQGYSEQENTSSQAPLFIHAAGEPEHPVEVQAQPYLFGFIPIPLLLMSDIRARVEERERAFDAARDFLAAIKDRARQYFRPLIDGLITSYNEWKCEKKVRVEDALPEHSLPSSITPAKPSSSVSNMILNAAALLPNTAALLPSNEDIDQMKARAYLYADEMKAKVSAYFPTTSSAAAPSSTTGKDKPPSKWF